MQTNLFYGCTLASWVDGRYVHPDVTFQGNSGSGWTTIASDEYDVHSALGTITQRTHDNDDNAVDWVAYQEYQDAGNTAFRCSYSVYNPSTNTATAYTNETQTVNYLTFGAALGSEITGRLTLTTAPYGQFLVGDYLSLGTVGTRPTDKNTGTGIWGDATGLYGLASSVQQVVFSAATGKISAGAGAVTMDADGITLLEGAATVNYLRWATSGGTPVGIEYTDQSGSVISRVSYPLRTANTDRVTYQLSANSDPTTGQSPSLGLFIVAHGSTHATHASKTWLNLLTNGVQTFSGFGIGLATSLTEPSSLLHLRDTAPTFRMEDTTASAKSLLVTVDANKAILKEVAGGNIVTLDLAASEFILNDYGIMRVIQKTGIADNSATGIFTITTTNETGNVDGGAFVCDVTAIVTHIATSGAGNNAVVKYRGSFSREIISTGTGTNTAVEDTFTGTSAASTSATRDIASVTMSVTETSEYVQTVNFTVDLNGSDVQTAEVTCFIRVLYTGFLTAPVIAAA